jgi:hypothetical protein
MVVASLQVSELTGEAVRIRILSSFRRPVIMCGVTGSGLNAKYFSLGLTRPKTSGAINHSRQTRLVRKAELPLIFSLKRFSYIFKILSAALICINFKVISSSLIRSKQSPLNKVSKFVTILCEYNYWLFEYYPSYCF